jgi:serine acetyltransferase
VLIKGGIKIGNGSVIGMGSVVTKDIGDYEIWAGNPARLIRKRFDDDTISELLKVEWWNFSDHTLNKQGNLINNIEHFIAFNTKRSN